MKNPMRKLLFTVLALCLTFAAAAGCAEKNAPETDVDVDLTALSSTMVMAEVNNMMENRNDYMGKTVKIRGPYVTSYYDVTDKHYHYVMIDACCMGFEFMLSGDKTYPDDYPEERAFIEITGVFDRYEELGEGYCYLSVDDDNISVLE